MYALKNHRRIRRQFFGLSVLGIALSCSACMSVPQAARLRTSETARSKSAETGTVHAIYQEEMKPQSNNSLWSKAPRRERQSDIQQLNDNQPQASLEQPVYNSGIQQVGYSQLENNGEIRVIENQAWAQTPSNFVTPAVATIVGSPQFVAEPVRYVSTTQDCPPNVVPCEPCPPDPRWPAAGPNPMAPGMMACDQCNLPSPEKHTDEYLCDGGDRELPVHYDSGFRKGLDSEDTVLEFTDRAGRERLKPSNKICIYAPRFASVRTVSAPQEESVTHEVVGLGNSASTGAIHTRLKASNAVKRDTSSRIAVRSRASGLDSDTGQTVVKALRSPSLHDELLNIYQSMTFVKSGKIDDADTARLNYGIQAAAVWTREQNPVITVKTDMALEGLFEQSSATITGIEEKEDAENLRIVKLTDKKTAVSGDEIEFTIRFDNLGGREVYHIRIVDNLTPRLQYVDDSATCNRKGRLIVQDNGEGSQILVWELEDPLPGKTGGVVTFKAQVR